LLATHHSTRRIQRNTHQEPRSVELEVPLAAAIYEVHGFALTALSWLALVRGVKDEAKTPKARYMVAWQLVQRERNGCHQFRLGKCTA
jgi:hypothetical protein